MQEIPGKEVHLHSVLPDLNIKKANENKPIINSSKNPNVLSWK